MSARKSRQDQKETLRSKRKVRFKEDRTEGEAEPGGKQGLERLAATPCGEWRPDQVAVAEGAKRQRIEEEDADKRESKTTGGSSGSDDTTPGAGGGNDDETFDEGRDPEELASPEGAKQTGEGNT